MASTTSGGITSFDLSSGKKYTLIKAVKRRAEHKYKVLLNPNKWFNNPAIPKPRTSEACWVIKLRPFPFGRSLFFKTEGIVDASAGT